MKQQSLTAKSGKFIILYLLQLACLQAGLEISTYFQGNALKALLQDYWPFFYAFPILTTCFIFKEVQEAPLSAVFGWTERYCLAAYSDGRSAWQYNQFAFFFRRRWTLYLGIYSAALFLALHAFFLPDFSPVLQSSIIAAITLSFVGANFFSLHRRTLRTLDMQNSLQQLSRHIRDSQTKLFRKLSSNEKAAPDECLTHFTDTLELCKEYITAVTGDRTIELAVRIAFPHPQEQGNVVYGTAARTKGLEQSNWPGEAIPANQGIPRCLIEDRNKYDVLLYRDMGRAIREKVFQEAEDDRQFFRQVASMMVAPLTGWDGKKKSMIGILYLTSGKKKAFREEHIDCMRFLADMLSETVSFSITVNHMLVQGSKHARLRQLLDQH
ncbi:MAG: hypothetical protein ACL93V_13055 [Candidatus Electrothrix sp. YB6]